MARKHVFRSEQEKLDALAKTEHMGLREAARLLNIPISTLIGWKKQASPSTRQAAYVLKLGNQVPLGTVELLKLVESAREECLQLACELEESIKGIMALVKLDYALNQFAGLGDRITTLKDQRDKLQAELNAKALATFGEASLTGKGAS